MKKVIAEFLGTFLLLSAIVGSGIMATNLTEDQSIHLLINAIAAVAMLSVIIPLFAEISGSHFNPAVTIYFYFKKELSFNNVMQYVLAQISGAIAGTLVASQMFGSDHVAISTTHRISTGAALGEVIATSGLLLVLALVPQRAERLIPLWIGAAYFFTASTSFANPAVSIGRIFTNTYAGIDPSSVPGFIAAELLAIPIAIYVALRLRKN